VSREPSPGDLNGCQGARAADVSRIGKRRLYCRTLRSFIGAGMTGIGASRPLARVPAKVPSLNAPAVTQTWWCEPLLMRRRGRWLPLPAFSSSLSYYDGCVALAARPICCRAYATISVPTLIVASTRRARSTRAGARTARKSRSASPPAAGHSAAAELSAPANNRWLAGCAVARAGFPCAL
jgi:hypothetical protein